MKGIASVNAIEIINSFPDFTVDGEDVKEASFGQGLVRFIKWVDKMGFGAGAANEEKKLTAKEK